MVNDEGLLKVGDLVEAKFRGRGTRWYKGAVYRVHDNGTCDIDYDDGDQDTGLCTKWVKKRNVQDKLSVVMTGNHSESVKHTIDTRARDCVLRSLSEDESSCSDAKKFEVTSESNDLNKRFNVSEPLPSKVLSKSDHLLSDFEQNATFPHLKDEELVKDVPDNSQLDWRTGIGTDELKNKFRCIRKNALRKLSSLVRSQLETSETVEDLVDRMYGSPFGFCSHLLLETANSLRIEFSKDDIDVISAKFGRNPSAFKLFCARPQESLTYSTVNKPIGDALPKELKKSKNSRPVTTLQQYNQELEQKIRLALEEAIGLGFNFLDKERIRRVNCKECFELLQVMGFEFTLIEVSKIWASSNLISSDSVDITDLKETILPFLIQLMKRSYEENEYNLKELTRIIGFDEKSEISINEFCHRIVYERKLLNNSEARALFAALDHGCNQSISLNETKSLLLSVNDGKRGLKKVSSNICFLGNPLARQALQKLAWGSKIPRDLHTSLQSFLGMPSTCRPSILLPLERNTGHLIESIMIDSFDDGSGMGIKNLSVKTIFRREEEKLKARLVDRAPKERSKKTGAELNLAENSNSIQFQLDLKCARGVPRPHDARNSDIVQRSVRIVLFRNNSSKGNLLLSKASFIGNICKVAAFQHPTKPECWTFAPKHEGRLLIRVDKDEPDMNVLLELSLTMRSLPEIKFTDKIFEKAEKVNDDNDDDKGFDDLLDERDFCCAWCVIPVCDVNAAIKKKRQFVYRLHGGTPFAKVKIKKEDAFGKGRGGWSEVFVFQNGTKKISEFEVGVTPIRTMEQDLVNVLPKTIICPISWIPLLSSYRQAIVDAISLRKKGDAVASSDPVLKAFLKILANPDLMKVLNDYWHETLKRKSGWANAKKMQQWDYMNLFFALVKKVWFASSIYNDKPNNDRFVNKTSKQRSERINIIRKIVFETSTDSRAGDGGNSAECLLFSPFHIRELESDNLL